MVCQKTILSWFWAFLEFKSANILIKTGLYFRQSVDIISTCYVYENRRKWFHIRTCENIAGKFGIRFFFKFLFWWSTLTKYWNHSPQSIYREFISPLGYCFSDVGGWGAFILQLIQPLALSVLYDCCLRRSRILMETETV